MTHNFFLPTSHCIKKELSPNNFSE
jgi:hypothetical protein